MRIALVSDCYLPRLGGIETQVAGLAQALAKADHEVSVYTATSAGSTPPGTCPENVDVHRLSLPLPASLPFNPLAATNLARELPRYDVVHVHCSTFSPLARAAAQTCARAGIPTVVTWHSVVSDMAPLFKGFYPLPAWSAAGLVLTAVSGPAAAAIEDIVHLPIDVLPNSINAQPWEEVRSLRQRATAMPQRGPLKVVTACRLVHRKRVIQLVRIVENARSQGANIDLEIYGDGVLLGYLRRLQRSGLAMKLAGRVDCQQLAAAYREADVFASAVTKEAFGIAALEAHACGLPVIYRDGAGICDFITNGEDGLAARSDQHFASLLVALDRDRAQLQNLQRGASEAAPVTWERAVKIVTGFYRRAQHQA